MSTWLSNIAVFIFCQLNMFLSRLVFRQDVEFYSIGPDHCLVYLLCSNWHFLMHSGAQNRVIVNK